MTKGRKIARTYLPPQLRDLLEIITKKTGLAEAEILRTALLEYAEKRSLIVYQLR